MKLTKYPVVVSFVFYLILLFSLNAFAQQQPVYLDIRRQDPGNSTIEHWVNKHEYVDAMTSGLQGLRYWAEPGIYNHAVAAANQINAGRSPTLTEALTNVPFENTSEDIKIRFGNCPTSAAFYGCFYVTNFWVYNNMYPGYNLWDKATIYVKNSVTGVSEWTDYSLVHLIEHELLHAYGLDEQYIISNSGEVTCNGSIYSMMDAFRTDPSTKKRYQCDNATGTNLTLFPFEIKYWKEYKWCCKYEYYNMVIHGDGTVISYFKDKAWNDHRTATVWQYFSNTTGLWTNFRNNTQQNYNGSHEDVPKPVGQVINVWENPGDWSVHNQYVRACAAAVHSSYYTNPNWYCTPSFFYGY